MNTIILSKDDVNSPIHPHLWETFCDDLNIDVNAEEICLQLSSSDTNTKTNFPQETH
jgi:hypothetical protein